MKKTKRKRRIPRTNWALAKVDYLKTKDLSVKEWGRQYFGSDSVVEGGNFAAKTKGWRDEKEDIWEEAKKEAVEQYRESTKDEAKIDIERAVKAKKRAWNILEGVLANAMDKGGKKIQIEVRDLEKAFKIIKTELGEESNIIKNLNLDLDEVKRKQAEFNQRAFNRIEEISHGEHTPDNTATDEDNEL
jgi:hypothetical protein